MKRLATLILSLVIIFSLVVLPGNASETIMATSSIELSYGHVKADDGIYLAGPYVYAGYNEVDLTGMNSIEIDANHQFNLTHEGEVIWVRIDSSKGKIIGTVYMERDTNGQVETFKGAIEPTEGKHKIYLMSPTGTSLKSAKIVSFKLSEETYTPVNTYTPVPDSVIVDTKSTTWALTDTLGRKAATFAEAGPRREGKYVGIFYHVWHWGRHNTVNYTEFMKKYPEAKYDYYHPAWPTVTTSHFWNEPLFGYYSNQDYWVYRKHAEMLSAAEVDFVAFDCSNGDVSMRHGYDVFFTAMSDARAEGLKTPKAIFMNAIRKGSDIEKTKALKQYLDMYSRGKWSDHWFYWEGKPLLLTYKSSMFAESGDPEDERIMNELKEFFTFRSIVSSTRNVPEEDDQWVWLQAYPQHPYGKNPDGTWEWMVVSPAANHSYLLDTGTSLNSPYATGRSYTKLLGQDKSAGAYMYGYNFTEKFNRVMEVDPEIMFITGWNEWTAGRSPAGNENLNSIVDTFDNEYSRDMEPTKGELGDVYYCIMVDAIRKFKGVDEIPTAGPEKTIDINNVASWEGVEPVFINAKGTYDRNYLGYNNSYNTNYTARNNVVKSLVSRDSKNFYFYAECKGNITAPEGDKWMKLYIDVDRNHATGWEGLDFVVNYPYAGAISSLNKDGSCNLIGNVNYSLNGKTLSIVIPRNVIGEMGTADLEFKWVDNAAGAEAGNILNFYVDGNAAPLGRFNYIYTEIAEVYASEETKKALKGVTVAGKNSPFAYIEGKKTYMYEPDTRYAAKDVNGITYIPAYFLYDALNYKVIFEQERNMFKLMGENKLYTTVGTNSLRLNGKAMKITNPVLAFDGIPYVSLSFFEEVLGLEIYDGADRIAFGHGINQEAVNQLVF